MRRHERLWDWIWKQGWRRRIGIAGVVVLVAGALIGSRFISAGLVVAAVGWAIIGLTFIWFLLASVKKALPSETRPAALAAVDVTALAFLVGFPLLVVVC